MALDAQILLSILAHESSDGDLSRTLRATPATYALALTTGTGENQAQVVWSAGGTTTLGGLVDFDLQSLQDDRGTVSFSEVKAIYIRSRDSSDPLLVGADWNDSTPANAFYDLPLLRNPANGAAAPLVLSGDAMLAIVSPAGQGYVVTGQSKVIRISADDGSTASYDILLIGEGTIT